MEIMKGSSIIINKLIEMKAFFFFLQYEISLKMRERETAENEDTFQ